MRHHFFSSLSQTLHVWTAWIREMRLEEALPRVGRRTGEGSQTLHVWTAWIKEVRLEEAPDHYHKYRSSYSIPPAWKSSFWVRLQRTIIFSPLSQTLHVWTAWIREMRLEDAPPSVGRRRGEGSQTCNVWTAWINRDAP
jgi:hypothetical protein